MQAVTFDSLNKIRWLQKTLDHIIHTHKGVLCDDLMYKKIINPSEEDGSYEKLTTLLVEVLNKHQPENFGHCEKCAKRSAYTIGSLKRGLE